MQFLVILVKIKKKDNYNFYYLLDLNCLRAFFYMLLFLITKSSTFPRNRLFYFLLHIFGGGLEGHKEYV